MSDLFKEMVGIVNEAQRRFFILGKEEGEKQGYKRGFEDAASTQRIHIEPPSDDARAAAKVLGLRIVEIGGGAYLEPING